MSFSTPLTEESPNLSVSFDLPEAVTYVTLLRKTSRCLTESLHLRREDAEDVELLLGELATNAARHSQSLTYRVLLQFFSRHAVITVSDQGVGFQADAVAEPGSLRADSLGEDEADRFGGFGLLLVYALADKVSIQSDNGKGTTVRVEKWFQ